jgi:hypothetical protein
MKLDPEKERQIGHQADHATNNGGPVTGAICRAMIPLARGETACGQRIADWPGGIIADAVPLRLAGGLHHLFRSGKVATLAKIYNGEIVDQSEVDRLISEIVERHDADLLPWFESPPQTNEAGRSANFIFALHWLASRVIPVFELNEIGSSAGMNLLIDRYQYDLGGVANGPEDSPVTIKPEWRGAPSPHTPFTISSVIGSDIQPIDVRDQISSERLQAYIWPDMPARFERMQAGIAMIREKPVNLVKAEAADWVEMRLLQPQVTGTTRVLMHSIVWQYLPATSQQRIRNAMVEAGKRATIDRPLAWISLETNRETFRHELRASYWPGEGMPALLGQAHAHGAWVESFLK